MFKAILMSLYQTTSQQKPKQRGWNEILVSRHVQGEQSRLVNGSWHLSDLSDPFSDHLAMATTGPWVQGFLSRKKRQGETEPARSLHTFSGILKIWCANVHSSTQTKQSCFVSKVQEGLALV